ncbi:TfoX/Sxy family protein [Pseudochryseolinea flava]|uniref:RNA methyltransferase n=1 Tax=Pseudochryseolinea flava TaxID=2059302 RepID=A0A364Y1J6_9BACT|nr:TfoX/Sxy family protein [Pseudochryseolinea flava]RAV99633.1 RNA methyltransferase [Pseudochryseolinea flava]
MAYNLALAERIRTYLELIPDIKVVEQEMFRGLAFLVKGKMCINVSGDNLMCRYDPALEEDVAERNGFEPMIMKGKQLRGYCYVNEAGYKSKANFEYWLKLCLDFNEKAKASKKKKKKAPLKRKVKK